MIKEILIDIDNTLLDFDKCSDAAIYGAFELVGETPPESILEEFHTVNEKLWRNVESGLITTGILYENRWNIIFKNIGLDLDGHVFERLFQKRLSEAAIPVKDSIQMLEYLYGKYTLCAASNAPYEQQVRRLESSGMKKYFKHIFISEKIGAEKPDERFFDACLKELNEYDKNSVLIIGDSLSADICGGAKYGIRTCWFNRKGDKPGPAMPDITVKYLGEIQNYL